MPDVKIPCTECVERGVTKPGLAIFNIQLTLASRDVDGRVLVSEQDVMNVCGVHYAITMQNLDLTELMQMNVARLDTEGNPFS